MKTFIATLLVMVMCQGKALAQCAMCRATLENGVGSDASHLAQGVNWGIMYLFVAPYLLVGVVALLWYRSSKKQASSD